jgi:hypothetical protein
MMQTDVKSYHAQTSTSGVAYVGRTRLKGAIVSNTTSGTPANIMFANNMALTATYSISTTTVTVTVAGGHGLTTGARVFLDYTSGNGTDNIYTITVTGTTTFTATVPSSSGTGNVNVYAQTLMEIDITNSVPVCVTIPGEGILANDGIYVGVPANIAATVFYG